MSITPTIDKKLLPLAVVWAVYAALVLSCALRHVAWFDEAQAWLLARDLTLWDLMTGALRYEGTPGLWHILLMPFAKLGFPYTLLSLISSTIAIAGVGLFLFYSPFPLWLRMLFPFCYVPLFQYSVIARSYVLFLPLLCGLAMVHRERTTKRPITYLSVAALIANVSLHGALMSLYLFGEWAFTAYREGFFRRRRLLACALMGSICVLFLVLFLVLRVSSVPLSSPKQSFGSEGLLRVMRQVSECFYGGLGSQAYKSASVVAAWLTLALSLTWFRKVSTLFLYLGMTVPVLALALGRAAYWHSGILFLIWIFVLWIAFERVQPGVSIPRWVIALVGAVFMVQAFFGLDSWAFNMRRTYSGSRSAAEYLKMSGEADLRIYSAGFKPYSIQPYFQQNLFAAQQHGRTTAFQIWPGPDFSDVLSRLDTERPDRVIRPMGDLDDSSAAEKMRAHRYCEEKYFDGGIWWKNGVLEPDAYVLFAPCK